MKLNTTFNLIFALIMSALLPMSCKSDDKADGYPDDVCIDFATFVSTSDRGSVFTLRKNGDSPLVTLTAAVKIDTSKLKPETRVLIQYLPSGGQAPYESGEITLYGIGLINNGGVEPQPLTTIESWASEPIKMTSLTRSGEYLDVWGQADYDTKITRFCLAADENTLTDEYPQLYLVFEGDDAIGYPHQLYASFDLSEVWNLESCSGVVVNYQSRDGNNALTFQKTINQ